MTTEDLSARLYVRLYTNLLDDEDMIELSYAAVGVYAATLLLSKHTATDGRVPLKLLRRDAALRPGTPLDEALEELTGAGLVTAADGHVTVRSWAKYNALSADIVAQRAARRESSRRANHERWHEDAFESCHRCNRHVSPSGSESDPPGSDPDPHRNPYSHSESDSHSDSQSQSHSEPPGPAPNPTVDNSTGAAAAGIDPNAAEVVALADSLMEHAGLLDAEAPAIIRRHVAQALAAHPDDDSILSRIVDAAVAVGSQEDVRRPEGLLRKKLEDLAYPKSDPDTRSPPGGGTGWQAAWAEAERILGGQWRGVEFTATALPDRTVAALTQIRRIFSDAGATKHDTRHAFRDAWLTAEPAPP